LRNLFIPYPLFDTITYTRALLFFPSLAARALCSFKTTCRDAIIGEVTETNNNEESLFHPWIVEDHPRRGQRTRHRAMHRAHWPTDQRLVAEIARRMRARDRPRSRAEISAFRCDRLIGASSRALIDDADSRRLAYLETRLPVARFGGIRGNVRDGSMLEPRVTLAGPFDLLAKARRGFSRPLRSL
jgi:hypothetical protein